MVKKRISFNPIAWLISGFTHTPETPSDITNVHVDENTVEYTAPGQIFVRAKKFPATREVEFSWRFLTINKKHQTLDIAYSEKPISASAMHDLMNQVRSGVAKHDLAVQTLIEGRAQKAHAVRHQFPKAGKLYFHIFVEGDQFEEEILHEVQLSKEEIASTVGTAEQKAEDVVRHLRDKVRGVSDIAAASATAKAEVDKLTLSPAAKKIVYGELQRETEALIRQFRGK